MEKSERETHDFMNVESFSQLPFIRPAPVKEKGIIRLFGIEFGGGGGGGTTAAAAAATDESESAEAANTTCEEAAAKDSDNGESSRKFECHYCCRNFPTSQALGGHQNAHKRERQHAKRAHLHSSMVHGGYSDYGLLNYRLSSAAPPPPPPPPAMSYHHHSWNSSSTNNINPYANTTTTTTTTATTNPRFYGSSYHHGSSYSHPPINGSPLALWRIPAVQNSPAFNRDRSMMHHHHSVPLFANEVDYLRPSTVVIGSSSSHTKSTVQQDHVSLDLHL